ncbi:MAG: phytoene desaturase family protein [Chloroflexota bacterium]
MSAAGRTGAPRVVVVGAGIGGRTAAIRLAVAGARVTVCERADAPGGKMGEVRAAGFRWDTGPSVITMRPVLAELFAAAGTRLEDALDLVPVDPLTRYLWDDGTRLDLARDPDAMLAAIAAIAPRDVDGWRAFLDEARRIHAVAGTAFIYGDPPGLGTVRRVPLRAASVLAPWRTMDAAIARHLRSPYLRQLAGRFATYVGASPFRAPATLNVIAHVELNAGVWYPRGGVAAIARALTDLAIRHGVEIRTGAEVTAIGVRDGRATGVTLADGTAIAADGVVANVDVATVLRDLLPARSVPRRAVRAAERAPVSLSGFSLLLGVRGRTEPLAHHTICFSRDYRAEFRDLFDRGLPPREPTVYLALTCRTDPEHAPAGDENWFVLVNAPPLGPAFGWTDAEAAGERDRVLDRLGAFGLDPRGRIAVERRWTPADLARTGAWRGALYGRSSNERLSAFRRAPNRSPHVRGLWQAGGTTHPGGGVPMVMLSGRRAARLAAADLGLRAPEADLLPE